MERRVTVLIVDDAVLFQRLLSGWASQVLDELRETGQIYSYEIRTASSPEEARALIAKEIPDILMSDNLFLGSEEWGADLVIGFAEKYPDRRAILVSGKEMPQALKAAVEQGRPNVAAIHKKGNSVGISEAIRRALSG